MSFFNVFRFFESVLVHDTNNVHLNKGLHLYLVGISFLEQKLFSFYLLLKSWHFPLYTVWSEQRRYANFIALCLWKS